MPLHLFSTIKAKIILGFTATTLVLMVVGAVGLYGTKHLSQHLSFITGPAWDTADGAMEGTIGLQGQMLAVDELLTNTANNDTTAILATFDAAGAIADSAINRLLAAGLMAKDQTAEVTQAITQHQHITKILFSSHTIFIEHKTVFDQLATHLVQLGAEMEEIGDSAIEEIKTSPEARHRWQGDLDTRWAAADGGMEANIGLLWGLYHLSRLLAHTDDPATIKTDIRNALHFQKEAATEMLNTQRFERSAGEAWGGQSYAAVYRDLFARYEAQQAALIEATETFHQNLAHYHRSSQQLLALLSTFEEQGDATVEQQIAVIDDMKHRIFGLVLGATLIGTLLAVIFSSILLKRVITPIKAVIHRISNIARGDGDLTQRLDFPAGNEMGDLARDFNLFMDSIHGIIMRVSATNYAMNHAVKDMLGATQIAAQKVISQREQADQIATAFNELAATSREVARNTLQASDTASSINTRSDNARTLVDSTIQSIGHLAREIESASAIIVSLEQDVNQIVSVLSVIQGIAEQTNLLALNAAIEAARAGEQGRGFAVVADEVRSLASKTQDSTKEINAMIERLQAGSARAVEAMSRSKNSGQETVAQSKDVAKALGEMSGFIAEINHLNAQIACAAEEQTNVSETMNTSVQAIANLAEELNNRIANSTQHCQNVNQQTQQLNQLLERFKV